MNVKNMIKEKWGNIEFPIICKGDNCYVPWNVAIMAYSIYSGLFGDSQSIERLKQRGGFHEDEMDCFYPEWRNYIIKKSIG